MRSTKEHRLAGPGRTLVVIPERGDRRTRVRVLDGDDVLGETEGGAFDTKKIPVGDGKSVRVRFDHRREVTRAELLDGDNDFGATWFEPPADSRAHRMWQFREDHPGWYAARRVVGTALGTLIGVLGIGALVNQVLSRVIPDVDLPDVSLPSFDAPDWLRYANPGYWLRAPIDAISSWLPNFSLPSWTGILVPIAISAMLAWLEVRKRTRRRGADGRVQTDDGPTNGEPTDGGDADR